MPANGPIGPESVPYRTQGLWNDPRRGADRQIGGDGATGPTSQAVFDQLLGARIDDIEQATADEDALRAFANHPETVSVRPPDSLTTRPPADSETKQVPSRPTATPEGWLRPRGEYFDIAWLNRQHAARPLLGDDHSSSGSNRHTVELIESAGEHFAFLLRGPIARDDAVSGGDDELARSRCDYAAGISRITGT